MSRTTLAVPISVLDKDIAGLELSLTRPIKIRGRVMVENSGSVPNFRFRIEANAWGLVSGPIRTRPDGTFDLVLPEKLRIELYDYPSTYVVKSVTYGPVDLLREPLKAGGPEMVITFAPKP